MKSSPLSHRFLVMGLLQDVFLVMRDVLNSLRQDLQDTEAIVLDMIEISKRFNRSKNESIKLGTGTSFESNEKLFKCES